MVSSASASASASSDGGLPLLPALPQSLIDASFKRGALKYKTRGLTSSIHTLHVGQGLGGTPEHADLRARLTALDADPALIAVKSVDLEEQPKPHNVEKEARLIRTCNNAGRSGDGRGKYILQLLSTATEEPDDFTTIHRLYFPYYPLTLSDWLDDDASRATPPTPPAQHLSVGHKIALQLYTALAFLHAQGISHRDIKPANVLLTTPDVPSSHFSIKLCDFGTATDELRPLTCSTSTHPYTPPELLFSPKDGYDGAKVDVWQAACVVAEIFGEREGGGAGGSSSNGLSSGRKRPHSGDDDDGDDGDDGDDPFDSTPAAAAAAAAESDSDPFGGGDDPFDSTPAATAPQPSWKSLQRTLFSDASDADDAWLRRGTATATTTAAHATPPAPPASWTFPPGGLARHRTLFPRSQPSMGGNDLALAAAHFAFCGLPSAEETHLWPEAVHFQPSLQRMPFPRREPPAQPDELYGRCALLPREKDGEAALITRVLLASLQLSQGKRSTAEECASVLEGRG